MRPVIIWAPALAILALALASVAAGHTSDASLTTHQPESISLDSAQDE